MNDRTRIDASSDHRPDSAFTTGTPRGLDRFVALHVRCGANRIEDVFAIDLRLEVDEWRLQVERRSGLLQRLAGQVLHQPPSGLPPIELRVRLRHCYVRYRCDGVSVLADSKYRSAVEIGAYAETQATSDRTAATRDRASRLDLAAALSGQPRASAAGSYRVGSSWQGSATVERTITASQDLYEVEAVPGGWRVGDRTHGDPLKRDGCLDGQYFARVIEGRPHGCEVEFLPGCATGTIDFAVTTRDGLSVEAIGGEQAAQTERDAAIATMRDRLAAICIERAATDSMTDELTLYEIQAACTKAREYGDRAAEGERS
ncbi:hypothetical protein QLH51_05800 [Sphingomonas sp. 2R-10]|uniref:hypothetical protein n=1 Tax=Sphingomonas sp. 2R-10 TaxID=3045148 RepID=UPI000F7B4F24|nr:hypothetical protein [Sphingomonas sp. 2R-10]MDJ0276311.1 hypothetical protein [Sphingomonas sp. 2R-10]